MVEAGLVKHQFSKIQLLLYFLVRYMGLTTSPILSHPRALDVNHPTPLEDSLCKSPKVAACLRAQEIH